MDVLLDTCGRRAAAGLLLLCVFVAPAAASCPKPRGGENIVLTNEALLMNDFPEGSKVTLECANGYVIESGTNIMSCMDGNWTEPDFTCKKKDCGPPKPQPNMRFNTSSGTLFGAVIRLVCDTGYQVSGSSYKQCYASGWSGRAKCEIVTCDTPAEVTNGRRVWDSEDDPTYGEFVQYICDEGHILVGNDKITCSETGEYDNQPPECEEAPTSRDSSATPTTHRDETITTSAAPAVSPSVRGGRVILPAEENATATSVMSTSSSSSFQDEQHLIVGTDVGYTPVIVSVICVSLAVGVFAVSLHKFSLKRKGSYDTREDLKPELLQFQNL